MNEETVDAEPVYLFGYPVEVSVKMSDTEIVDITHAVQWDGGGRITLDPTIILDAIHDAEMRGFGLKRPS